MTADSREIAEYLGSNEGIIPGARFGGHRAEGEGHLLKAPGTGQNLGRVGWVGSRVANEAVKAVSDAGEVWAATPPGARAEALRRIARSLRDDVDVLADIVCLESGKRIAEARGEVMFSAQYFDWFADAVSTQEDGYRTNGKRRFVIQRKPSGVVAAISPWNFPLSIPARKVAPALAAGCTVIQKASELTPLSSIALTKLCEKHLPQGVVGIVVGEGLELTSALVDNPYVKSVSFTGSTAVGISVATRAMETMTRVTMELGGKAPFIVCDDTDLDVALEALMVAKFRNNGASCVAANNVYVHNRIYDRFLTMLRESIGQLTVGDPMDPKTDLGPMISQSHVSRLQELLAKSAEAGSDVWQPADAVPHGSYMAPTLVECSENDPLWGDEIFGPVCAVRRFRDENKVVDEINSWNIGLGGYVCSTDQERQMRLASMLNIGIVGVNNGAPNTPEVPFGGFGYSGFGREGSMSGLWAFSEEQTVSLRR